MYRIQQLIDPTKPLVVYMLGEASVESKRLIEEKLSYDRMFQQEFEQAENELISAYLNFGLSEINRRLFEINFLCTDKRCEKLEMLQNYEERICGRIKQIKETPRRFLYRFFLLNALTKTKIIFICFLLALLPVMSILIWNLTSLKRGEVALVEAYSLERPLEPRISGFRYAQYLNKRDNQPIHIDNSNLSKAQYLIAFQITSENIVSIKALGRMKLAEKNYDQAIESFKKVLNYNSNDARTENDIAVALMSREKANFSEKLTGEGYSKAIEHLHRAIRLDPELLEAHFNIALCRQYQMLWRTAADAWKKYLQIDRDSLWADEAKKNLKYIEEKIVKEKKNIPQIITDFKNVIEKRDYERAWVIYRDNRNSTGSFIINTAIDEFVSLKLANKNSEAEMALQPILYIGQEEQRKSGDKFTLSLAHFYEGASKSQLNQLIHARTLFKKAIDLQNNSQLESSLQHLDNAYQIYTQTGNIAEALITQRIKGYIYFRQGKTQYGISILTDGSEKCQTLSFKWLWGTYQNGLYNVNLKLTEYSRAQQYNIDYIKSMTESEDNVSLLHGLVAASELASFLGKYQETLQYSYRGFTLADKINAPVISYLPLYIYSSKSYQEFGNLDVAYDYQMEGVTASLELNNPWLTSLHYTCIAQILNSQNKNELANIYLHRALELSEKIPDDKLSNETKAYSFLYMGKVYRDEGGLEESIKCYAKVDQILNENEIDNPYLSFENDKGKLLTYIKRKDYAATETLLSKVMDNYELHRNKIENESSRNAFFNREQNIYDIAIEYAYVQLQDAYRSFDYSEMNRSRSLLNAVKLLHDKNLPNEKYLVSNVSHFNKPLNISNIQQQMPEQSYILQYSLTKNNLIIWVISKSTLNSTSVQITSEELKKKVDQYLALIEANWRTQQNSAYKHIGVELYNVLIKPIEKFILEKNFEICLVPDKDLNRLPFATLISPTTGRYFIEEHVIYVSPSANMFIATTENANERELASRERLLAIGPAQNHNLGGADRQTNDLNSLYSSVSTGFGDSARETYIRKKMQWANIVDFATHYILDKDDPLLSYIPLAGETEKSLSIDDGKLQVYEVLKMNLPNLKLAVLSACKTGVETYDNSEGAIGLARAFQSIGVPLVIASLWPVEDYPSRDLIVEFHKQRKINGLSAAKALQAAQVKMINSIDPHSHSPYRWAAYVLYGGHANY